MESDAQLLAQYIETRDAEAFADLVKRYAGMVYGTCLRVTGNAQAAEDASQECFLSLARQAGTVRSSVGGWLHRAAVNRALSERRRDSRRRTREEKAAKMNWAAKSSEGPTWAEIAPYVDEALAGLPDELRDPLIGRFLQGKTQALVAEELQVDQSTISRRMDRGLERLRAALKRRGVMVTSTALGTLLLSNTAQAAPVALTAALGKMAMAGIAAGGKSVAATAATSVIGGAVMSKAILISAVAVGAILTTATVAFISTRGGETQSAQIREKIAPIAQEYVRKGREEAAVEVTYAPGSEIEFILKKDQAAHLDCVGDPYLSEIVINRSAEVLDCRFVDLQGNISGGGSPLPRIKRAYRQPRGAPYLADLSWELRGDDVAVKFCLQNDPEKIKATELYSLLAKGDHEAASALCQRQQASLQMHDLTKLIGE